MRKLIGFSDRGGLWNIAFLFALIAGMYHMLDGSHTTIMVAGWVAGGALAIDFWVSLMPLEEE